MEVKVLQNFLCAQQKKETLSGLENLSVSKLWTIPLRHYSN